MIITSMRIAYLCMLEYSMLITSSTTSKGKVLLHFFTLRVLVLCTGSGNLAPDKANSILTNHPQIEDIISGADAVTE